MKALLKAVLLAVSLVLCGQVARAQAPLAKPLADFDKLVSQLKISDVVGEPIRAGDTAVIPFAKISFALGGGGAVAGFGGSMGGKTIPLGVLIVEGDDVRAELFPDQEEKPSVLDEIVKAILDRKVVFMVNGLNIGQTNGTIQDLAPLVSEMMGQTTVMVQALNLGSLKAPAPAASSAASASMAEFTKLFDAKKYLDALAMADALIAKDPKNADLHVWKGRTMGVLAQATPLDLIKYGPGAMEEFEKALSLEPNNPDAHLGRGVGRLAAPPGFGGDLDGAIADIQAAIVRKPSPEAYYYLGEASRKKGLPDQAAAAYKKALTLRPDYPEASKALAAIQ
jgi:uncharacterized spore protein YtfJ